MNKNWFRENAILCSIIVGFVIVLLATTVVFINMDKGIDKENEEAMREVGSLYVSSAAQRTVRHSQTYFESYFALMNQTLDAALAQADEQHVEMYLQETLSEDFTYVSLLAEDGQTKTLRGDESYVADDFDALQDVLAEGESKVILLTSNGGEDVAMVFVRDYAIDGHPYAGLICGFPADVLNSVFHLSSDQENLTYSFVICKEDSTFVVRNEGELRMTYDERIRAMYEPYNGKVAEDYVTQLHSAMQRGEVYEDEFAMEGKRRMLYATSLPYSDWYLVTFIRYVELEKIMGDNNDRRDAISLRSVATLVLIFLAVFFCYECLSYGQIKKLRKKEQEAVQANKAKSEFLSNMSHDIRTPMNAIVGMTEIAKSNIEDRDRVENCLDKISLSSRHLLSLINDVLDMSKIESGKMTLSVIQMSLQECMESIVMIVQPQIKSRRQKFDIYTQNIISEEVYGDHLRLNQVLINLVSNAVKYTPEEGTISLTLSQEASPQGDAYVRTHFYVRDNGVGMTEDFIKVIFDSFMREDRGRVTKEEGTGLGLTITKHIVDAMGGTIEVESKVNEGSEFHVVLDLKKGDIGKEDMRLEGLNVLVVDDNEEQCRNVQEMLREIGAQAEYVLCGKAAIEKIRRYPEDFDVVLIDWQMPGMNGIETARQIREYTRNDIPVILISAYDCTDFEEESKNAGIHGFIAKPLFKSTLFYGVRAHISHEKHSGRQPEAPVRGFGGERVLLAEDNELNGEIAMELLSSAGLLVDWEQNGQLCVDRFTASPEGYYKLILMDVRMPVMDGYEATAAIRALHRIDAGIPILAMTADAFAEDVAKAKECGMNGHIAKPLDAGALFANLKKELKNAIKEE